MATYAWRNTSSGGGGAVDAAGSWNNVSTGTYPASSAPTTTDLAMLAVGGGSLTGVLSVDTIAFAAAAWGIAAQLSATTVTIDNCTVSATTNGGQLVANGSLTVGASGGAVLSVANGGIVSVTGSSTAPTSAIAQGALYVYNRGYANFGGTLRLGGNGLNATATVSAGVLSVGSIFSVGAAGAGAGSGTLTINAGGVVVLSAATDGSTPYLQVGAGAGVSGAVSVDGANSLLLLSNNSGAIGYVGTGSLTVTNGGAARFNASTSSSNNALNPALTIGRYGQGTVTVYGSGSTLAVGGSIIVGTYGSGSLSILGGASATSASFAATQAALAVSTVSGGNSVTIDGSGSSLVASGAAIIGGDDRGSGLVAGGTGTITVSNGGVLQTGTMTILGGSVLSVDSASQAVIGGALFLTGTVVSSGTLVISAAVYGGGLIQLGGGIADIASLGASNTAGSSVAMLASNVTVRLHGLVGTNTVTAMQLGDTLDFVGNTAVRVSGNTITTTTGTLNLPTPSAGLHYQTSSDSAGGTYVALAYDTIGVYRFFDLNYGTHFFSASGSEKSAVIATRPDLAYEGIGLQSVNPASNDPNAAAVYRFFDLSYGTHFFTASSSERDTVIATRPDLVYEGSGFIEHLTMQTGDTAVYRFFDSKFGTHFYTADASERATIVATRPDLIDEGIGFYAPTS